VTFFSSPFAFREALEPTELPVLFSSIKLPGLEAGHSPSYSSEVKNMWCYTSTPPYVFMARYLYLIKYFLHKLQVSVYFMIKRGVIL
jgi:hypothetical protein